MLPKIENDYFSIVLPASMKKVNFRSFTVNDQKHFLMNEENNEKSLEKNYKFLYELVKKCCTEEIDNFYTVDFDWLFFQIRKYSIGNEMELNFNYEEDEKKEKVNFKVNITDDIKITDCKNENLKLEIKTKNYLINLEQPKIKDIIKCNEIEKDSTGFLIACMLKSVRDIKEEKNYNDFSLEDAKSFLENLPSIEYEKIIDFLSKNPKIYFDKKIKLSNGEEISLSDKSFINFFL